MCVAPQLAGGGVEEAARVRGVVELCSVYRRERLCVCVCVCVCVLPLLPHLPTPPLCPRSPLSLSKRIPPDTLDTPATRPLYFPPPSTLSKVSTHSLLEDPT